MNDPKYSIIDVLGHSKAREAGEIGQHAGKEAIGKILSICGNISERQARDISLAIAFGIILGAHRKLADANETYKAVAEATCEEYTKDDNPLG